MNKKLMSTPGLRLHMPAAGPAEAGCLWRLQTSFPECMLNCCQTFGSGNQNVSAKVASARLDEQEPYLSAG